jgi:beta-glucosidase
VSAPDSAFRWAVGIEDTFIPQLRTRTGRTLDEYELTGHYRHWREDLALAASTGVRTMRYGIPWYRVNPAPGTFDWSWTDEVLEHMVRDVRIDPIVDLMHYGCPTWLDREFVNPDYPERVAEYAEAFAERYRSLVSWYTPLNEPRINARLCGMNATWPPYLRGDRGYVRVMLALARGMSLTVAALRRVQPEATMVMVDATEWLETDDPALHEALSLQMEQQYLGTDLLLGRVDDSHALMPWLRGAGAEDATLDWLRANGQRIDVMGINYYPELSRKRLFRTATGVRRHRGGGWTDELERILGAWSDRYGLPLMITETSAARRTKRLSWLEDSVAAAARSMAAGVPLIGYTWWPLFSLVTWNYRGGRKAVDAYLAHMGLWDLRPDGAGNLARVRTPVADRFTEIVRQGPPHPRA